MVKTDVTSSILFPMVYDRAVKLPAHGSDASCTDHAHTHFSEGEISPDMSHDAPVTM